MFRRKADARDVGNSGHFPAGGCLHFGDAFVPGCGCVAPVPGCAWSGFGDGDAVFPNRAGDAATVDGSVPLGNRHHGDFLGEVFDGLFDARIRPAPVPSDEALLATRGVDPFLDGFVQVGYNCGHPEFCAARTRSPLAM